MSLQQLWAAWRSAYVAAVDAEATSGAPLGACVFCTLIAQAVPGADQQVVYNGPQSVVVLNAYPYTSGHVLVLPRRHVGDLSELSDLEATDLWRAARAAVVAIEAAYEPDGVNLGANLGKAAGAGLPDHLHLHVLPRWHGDTNFMTTVASTRVLPEALETSGDKLRAAWPDR